MEIAAQRVINDEKRRSSAQLIRADNYHLPVDKLYSASNSSYERKRGHSYLQVRDRMFTTIRSHSDDPPRTYPVWGEYLVYLFISSSVTIGFNWSGNEIHYFDLAHRWVNSGAFTEFHAVRDSSGGRIIAFFLIGGGIHLWGMEAAYAVFTSLFVILVPAAYLCLVRALRVNLLPAALSIAIFLAGPQCLVAREFLFGSIEPKSFSYVCVLFGLACGFSGRRSGAAVFFVAAVYFHFLVGAFWGSAALVYYALSDKHLRDLKKPLALFVSLTLPLFGLIAFERLAGPTVQLHADAPSLAAIYSDFRHPHHLSPFTDFDVFWRLWSGGFLIHGLFSLGLGAWVMRSSARDNTLAIWLCGLNAYMIAMMVLAFLDRETHLLSMFFIFRPGALTLLLTLIWCSDQLVRVLNVPDRGRINALSLALVLAVCSPSIVSAISRYIHGPILLETRLSLSEAQMVTWIRSNTSSDSVWAIEPVPNADFFRGEGSGQWAGMERLIERPTLVNFKFVPTAKADLARWYNLLFWREAVFAGACERIDAYPVDYLITRTVSGIERLRACTRVVWQGERNAILVVLPAPEYAPAD